MRRRNRAAFVLAYHRVAADPFNGFLLSVHPKNFRQQLLQLRAAGELVPLEAIMEPARKPRIAITFDDGYFDNLSVALPILEELDVPATVFITVGNVQHQQPFWWDQLEAIISSVARNTTWVGAIAGHPVRLTFTDDTNRRNALNEVLSILVQQDHQTLVHELSALRMSLRVPTDLAPMHRPLSADECQVLARSPLITIGAHTVNHPDLTKLEPEARIEELRTSKQWLEVATGSPVSSFCYPFGRWNEEVLKSTADCGYRLACTLEPKHIDRETKALRLPRFVAFDHSEDTFSRFLQDLL